MACPEFESLSAFHDDAIPGAVSEHVSACAACRALLGELEGLDRALAALPQAMAPAQARRLEAALSRRRRPWLPLAAAGLLAAAVLGWKVLPRQEPAPAGPAPVQAGPARLGEGFHLLAPGVALRLSPGAAVEVSRPPGAPFPELAFLSGAFSVESEAGPLRVETPAGPVVLDEGWLVLEMDAAGQASLFRDARAGEQALRATLLEGKASLGALALSAGQTVRWGSGSPVVETLAAGRLQSLRIAWQGVEPGWRELARERTLAGREHLAVPMPEGAFLLEARLKVEEIPAGGDLGIAYRAGGRRCVWWLRGGLTAQVLGGDPLRPGSELVVRIWTGGEVAVSVNGRPCLRIPAASAQDSPAVPTGMDAGVLLTAGKARVLALRARKAGP